ncbi:hypothetical protein D1872_227550 [compost metagenome]
MHGLPQFLWIRLGRDPVKFLKSPGGLRGLHGLAKQNRSLRKKIQGVQKFDPLGQ